MTIQLDYPDPDTKKAKKAIFTEGVTLALQSLLNP